MRIIAGTYKGTRLQTPKSARIRPTTDRVREYIFSCINMDVVDSYVLDLFAGTGALGIEALSRKAAFALFVDSSYDSIELVQKNLEKVKYTATTIKKSAESFLKNDDNKYHFIFCDPPYRYDRFALILETILSRNLLYDDGIIIYESGSKDEPVLVDGYEIIRQKKMGDTTITFYKMSHE